MLDLDEDDFCKIVDAVGFDKLAEKQGYYKWLIQAKDELNAKENYLKTKARLRELEKEKKQLEEDIAFYRFAWQE